MAKETSVEELGKLDSESEFASPPREGVSIPEQPIPTGDKTSTESAAIETAKSTERIAETTPPPSGATVESSGSGGTVIPFPTEEARQEARRDLLKRMLGGGAQEELRGADTSSQARNLQNLASGEVDDIEKAA